ncbi:hypothetical protein [Streptomyces afghaniensis]|uniref:hypothetical protein n=1 Tax=Streptomyces afghaniensis TaxID=66865 RepID=UPI0027866B22|nr:hypothetical protein [Streptomyces afghaniensis]MDQ1018942.1 hypothetical protein [Streptomyces afghaniensis]
MKMPRVECPNCERQIAAGIVAGRPGKGRLWRHDPTERPELFGDALVSCTGSLEIVDLPTAGVQLEFDQDDAPEPVAEPAGPLGTLAMF